MTEKEAPQNPQMLQHMATINRLNIKAFNTKRREDLIFMIVNDTIHAIRYDRAELWDMERSKPKLLGVSGQVDVNKDARLTKQWQALVHAIKDPHKAQLLTVDSFSGATNFWHDYQEATHASVLWLPIFYEEKLVLGLWIEIFGTIKSPESVDDTLKFLSSFLAPGYGSAWGRLKPKFHLKEKGFGKKQVLLTLSAVFVFLLIMRVPLRVVAPCQVVPREPIIVTAQLDGIIEQVLVEPGEAVKKNQIIVEYDKRVPLRNLNVAEKQVEILEAEANRAKTLGLEDKKSRTELGIINLKLEKEKVNLNLARWQASQLTIKAPEAGIVMIDDPDSWRGKPVQVGEKILTINDPHNTKVRIWIPEDDNVVIDRTTPIKVFLNIDPEKSYFANLEYLSIESTLSEQYMPSFIAEANWVEQPENVKLGLKGTAILYGDRVSLFYYIIRKPWAKLRTYLGS